MTDAAALRSGKGHRDENFPVASWLIAERHRAPIMAFYEFVRTADDVADNATLGEQEKLDLLNGLEGDLLGKGNASKEAVTLRNVLTERALSPQHALDLLRAFKQDASKHRYADWDDLIDYCRYSAMPVGRYVLDVHGESRATWPASDAICAALQINNHLQDCVSDYRDLDRVYVPLDAFAKYGLGVETLGAPKASPQLRQCLSELAARNKRLLAQGETLPRQISDFRLSLEISAIYALAIRIADLLIARDPLSENVKLSKGTMLGVTLMAALSGVARRVSRRGDIIPAANR
ncbi:MAG: squalene synthase HpnC [Xanthobacteraceae bacterium]